MRVCLLSCVITRNLFMSRKKRSNNPFAHLRLFHVCAFFAVLYEIIANQSFSNLIPSKIKYLSRKRIDLNKFFLFRQMFLVIWKRSNFFCGENAWFNYRCSPFFAGGACVWPRMRRVFEWGLSSVKKCADLSENSAH